MTPKDETTDTLIAELKVTIFVTPDGRYKAAILRDGLHWAFQMPAGSAGLDLEDREQRRKAVREFTYCLAHGLTQDVFPEDALYPKEAPDGTLVPAYREQL